MKICFIGKQPPIQGGVSRSSYWMMVALAERGIDVHVVTNANEVEAEFRIHDFWPEGETPQSKWHDKITIHQTAATQPYIPNANPFVTKLATLATDVVRTHQCDLIYAYYYEPYGMAAYLTSQWTGVPFGVRHAGSDIGRLMRHALHRTAYEEMLKAADFVFGSPSTYRRLLHFGLDQEKVYAALPNPLPDEETFVPTAAPLDLNDLRQRVQAQLPKTAYTRPYHELCEKHLDPAVPTIGIYGKVGESKGSYDLLAALQRLKEEGHHFNFVALSQGRQASIDRFVQEIDKRGLAENSWLFPFIPHWHVPGFIRACTAICFLERQFDVAIHSPSIPREIWGCATALILSRDLFAGEVFRERCRDGENILLAAPQNHKELADKLRLVVTSPKKAAEIGRRGYEDLGQNRYTFARFREQCADQFQEIYRDIQERREAMSVAEMQACLARLYIDEPFRKLFYLEPDDTIKNYKLTAAEKTAIQGIDQTLLDGFARSLKNKGKRKFLSAYPLIFKLGKPIHRYYTRYYELYPARPGQRTLEQIESFGEFMTQTLVAAEDVPPFAHEVARYEQLYYLAKFKPSSRDSLARINERPKKESPAQLEDYPQLVEGIYTAVFAYDIPHIVDQLREENIQPEAPLKQSHVVFQQVKNSQQPRIFAVTAATHRVLELCTGSHTVAELVTTIEDELQKTELQAPLLQILRQLQESEIVHLG